MKESGIRHARLEELLFEELQSIIPLEMQDPRLVNCRVTRVRLSSDLKLCQVYFFEEGSPDRGKAAEKALHIATSFITSCLCVSLAMRFTPKLQFHFDQREEEVGRLDDLFRQIESEHHRSAPGEGTDENG